jgi:arylsulfatase
MIVHAPRRIAPDEAGSRRNQFVNVADIAPTIYELTGVTPADTYRGLEQLPITGHSFASVLGDADAPATNTLQYFEMAGSRAVVAERDGVPWKAVCKHDKGADYDAEPWELYRLAGDWSECTDLADAEPAVLAELIDQWWREADRHGVLPLDDRMIELFGVRFRPQSPHPADRRYVYRPPMSPLPAQAAAAIGGRSFDLTARVTREAGQDGVLFATGTQNSGISIFVQDERLVIDYNAFDDHTILESAIEVPVGDSTLVVSVRRGDGAAGSMSLEIDGQFAGSAELPLFMRMMSSVGPSVAYDHGSAVSSRYRAPFAFAGTLHEIVIQLLSRQAADSLAAEAATELSRQ